MRRKPTPQATIVFRDETRYVDVYLVGHPGRQFSTLAAALEYVGAHTSETIHEGAHPLPYYHLRLLETKQELRRIAQRIADAWSVLIGDKRVAEEEDFD